MYTIVTIKQVKRVEEIQLHIKMLQLF